MAGFVVELVISWLLLKHVAHQNMSVLGLLPNRERLKQLVSGIIITATYLSIFLLIMAFIVNNPYHLNDAYSLDKFRNAFCYVANSVIYEELIFRGALLYILINKIGTQKALLVSAVAFGVYHWFSFGIVGQVVPMIFVFVITALIGYVFALSFAVTKSMYLPLALHLGYNFTFMIVFSNNMGNQLFVKAYINDPVRINLFFQIVTTAIHFIGVPFVMWLYVRYLNNKASKKINGCLGF